MKVLDNILCESEFKYLQEYFYKNLPWYYLDHVVNNGEHEDLKCIQFTHTFFNSNDPYDLTARSEHRAVIKPILLKLRPWLLLRAKANLRPISSELIHSSFHTDLRDLKQLTAIYYLNTCDGYTLFNDGTKVTSVENRLLIFDGSKLHCGSSTTDSKSRMVLNINYFPSTLPDGSKYVP